LQLIAPNTETLPFDTYVVVTDDLTPPGPPPAGWQLLSKSYSVRAPKTILQTRKAMILKLFYQPDQLAGLDPRTLVIAAWNGTSKKWEEQPSSRLVDRSRLDPPHVQLGAVQEFTVYALLATNAWHDDFVDLDGLDKARTQNLRVAFGKRGPGLALADNARTGSAVSLPITAPHNIKEWTQLTFTGQGHTPTTTITVDVLDANGALLLAAAPNQSNLGAAIDAATHPTIRLRVTMSSTVAGQTPLLENWQVRWQVQQPVVVRAANAQVAVGDVVTVPLTIRSAAPQAIGGLAFAVRYDPTLLAAQSCVLTLNGTTGFCNSAYDTDKIEPDSGRFSLLLNQVITGPVTLGALHFTVLGRGATPAALDVTDLLITNPAGVVLPALDQDGALQIAPGLSGDVNCDNTVDQIDAAFILEFDAGLRIDGKKCPLPPTSLFVAQCDLNGDMLCNLLDALKIIAP
jgi:hypothetical protein